MKKLPLLGLVTAMLASLTACATEPAVPAQRAIHLNQAGYLPSSSKLAVVGLAPGATPPGDHFSVVDSHGKQVLEGSLGPAALWLPAGQQARVADLSALHRPGSYRVQVDGLGVSEPLQVNADAYLPVLDAALKAYYFNRASTALPERYAGAYARAAGHPDTQVRIHASATSPGRPEGTLISAPKGWYDAGDYNKYVVNSGISTYTLLAAYEQFPKLFASRPLQIPDDAHGVPGILQEAAWNLQWLLAMQDPADGGVYHKLTTQQFEGIVMPDQARQPRYVVMKSTAATLDFAAVMAVASRIYAPFEKQYPGMPAKMREAALQAWQWANAHPDVVYKQPADVHTGGYDDAQLDDEFAWAAAELLVATGDAQYWEAFTARNVPASVPSWGNVAGLAWMSLAAHRAQLPAVVDRVRIDSQVGGLAARLADRWQGSPWRLAMDEGDFQWGSNAIALNQAMMLLQGYRLSGERRLLDAAQSQFDYVLGRNPLAMSFVTGIGVRSPQHIHHRISEADGIAAPVPGLLAGGPHAGQQDAKDCKVAYPSQLPALSYLDATCSYATNEVAINWNAPLVYVSAALQALTTR